MDVEPEAQLEGLRASGTAESVMLTNVVPAHTKQQDHKPRITRSDDGARCGGKFSFQKEERTQRLSTGPWTPDGLQLRKVPGRGEAFPSQQCLSLDSDMLGRGTKDLEGSVIKAPTPSSRGELIERDSA
jgi:hypothetical protein